MENVTENYWKTLQNINDLIKFSDAKAGIIITVYGVILTFIYSNAAQVYNWLNSSPLCVYMTITTAVFATISLIFAFLSINPSLSNKNPKSFIYFGHIKSKNKDYKEYYFESTSIFSDTEKLSEQLSSQIFDTSRVAWKKFRYVTYSLRLFFISFFLLLIILALYLIN